MGNDEVNLASWMKDLPPYIRDMPLNTIAIPGSHDSMTFGIPEDGSSIAPDFPSNLNFLHKFFPSKVVDWSKTQELNATNQLLIGIRYLDLRVATKPGTLSIFFTHGLYAGHISKPMLEIRDFVDSHPGEVVVLDFQHFYEFKAQDHGRLVNDLMTWYGDRLVPEPYPDVFENITLNKLASLKQSIIIVYRARSANYKKKIWVSSWMHSPWTQQTTTSGLLKSFRYFRRGHDKFFVHQAVLTPTSSFVASRLLSNLREECAKPVLKDVIPVIAYDYSPGPVNDSLDNVANEGLVSVNVVIADFVDLNNNLFPKTIIAMNKKLEPSYTMLPTPVCEPCGF